jgi:transposase
MGQRGRPSVYSQEFRRDAIELVRSSGRPIAQIADELGVNRETLRGWVRYAEKRDALAEVGVGQGELDELARLRRENAELKIEREILRKAAQYFAKEMGR